MIAVDFSSYSAVPDAAMINCWKQAGVTRAVIGTRGNVLFEQQVQACIDNGLEVEAYEYLYFNQNGAAQVNICKARCDEFPEIKRIWIDVELADGDPNPGTAAVSNVIADAVGATYPYEAGIYTSRNYWVNVFALPNLCSDLPLWNAYYDGDPDVDFASNPYGGWTGVAMEQYQGSTDLCGENVDLSAIVEEEVTQEQIDEIVKRTNDHTDMKIVQLIGWINDQKFVRQP